MSSGNMASLIADTATAAALDALNVAGFSSLINIANSPAEFIDAAAHVLALDASTRAAVLDISRLSPSDIAALLASAPAASSPSSGARAPAVGIVSSPSSTSPGVAISGASPTETVLQQYVRSSRVIVQPP